jgi:periplasmic divalent cation tolerance protein
MTGALTLLCTCPDQREAERMASGLVDAGLAACVNILPEIRSIYRWRGEVRNDAEVLMIVKSTRKAYPKVERWILEHHPYEVPEILALEPVTGAENYLRWLESEVQ